MCFITFNSIIHKIYAHERRWCLCIFFLCVTHNNYIWCSITIIIIIHMYNETLLTFDVHMWFCMKFVFIINIKINNNNNKWITKRKKEKKVCGFLVCLNYVLVLSTRVQIIMNNNNNSRKMSITVCFLKVF